MHYFSGVLPKWVLLHQMEISCHIFKLALFSKFFSDLMSHMIREYAGKEMKWFLNLSSIKIMDIILSPFMVFNLYYYLLLPPTAECQLPLSFPEPPFYSKEVFVCNKMALTFAWLVEIKTMILYVTYKCLEKNYFFLSKSKL